MGYPLIRSSTVTGFFSLAGALAGVSACFLSLGVGAGEVLDAALCSAGDDSDAADVEGSLADTVTGAGCVSVAGWIGASVCVGGGAGWLTVAAGACGVFSDDPENAKNQTAIIIPRNAAAPKIIPPLTEFRGKD